jgi:precorrin-2 dehydrogenase/sirohydrochlorin ferrochelatase
MTDKPRAQYYPAFLDVSGRRCVVVGGGRVAERKARALAGAGAGVTVVSPEICSEMESLATASPNVHVALKPFEAGDLADAFLAVAATDDAGVNEAVSRAAHGRSILVNVVDQPALSSFIVPAAVSRGRLHVAVSTAGASPAFAARLRRQLDEQLDPRLGAYVEAMAGIRAVVLEEVPDPAQRLRIFEALASGETVQRYLGHEPATADAWLMDEARRLIARAEEPA